MHNSKISRLSGPAQHPQISEQKGVVQNSLLFHPIQPRGAKTPLSTGKAAGPLARAERTRSTWARKRDENAVGGPFGEV